MTDTIAIGITIAVFALPCGLLAMALRHFVPLIRGFNAPLWAYALGPIAFASDRFLSEAARPHRKPFIRYVSAFVMVSLALLVVASGGAGVAPLTFQSTGPSKAALLPPGDLQR